MVGFKYFTCSAHVSHLQVSHLQVTPDNSTPINRNFELNRSEVLVMSVSYVILYKKVL